MVSGSYLHLRPFQTRFLRAALAPGIRTAALCLPRGNGKSTLVAWLAARALTPGDPLFVSGAESHIVAASVGQARRTTFKLLREFVEGPGYRIAESPLSCHAIHKATNTRISVLASSGKTSQGLVRCPWVFADEPGSWEINGGALLHDAIRTAAGKPGAELRAIYLGTLAPLATAGGHWWFDLVAAGSAGSTHVAVLRGDVARWDQASEIQRCNPLMWAYPESRAVLLEERDKARADSRLRAAFQSYRLNAPTADESTVLLPVADWDRVCARPVPERSGRPLVGVDLGGGRAWSAAVAIWPDGRCEAVAVAPGVPALDVQERRDRVPAGTYTRLLAGGRLTVADGLRVPTVAGLVERIMGWRPIGLVCDRFRLPELLDAAAGRVRVAPRIARWSSAAEDVRALRRLALDGPLSVEPASRGLIATALSVAAVKSDDQGSTRLVKRDPNNSTGRDDVAAAAVLAAGAWSRRRPAARVRIHAVGA